MADTKPAVKPRRPKTKLNIPNGFQDILEQFAREVLIEQPQDVLLFGQTFFTERISRRDAVKAKGDEQQQGKKKKNKKWYLFLIKFSFLNVVQIPDSLA